jgi:isopenicillin N synthase-like dioxygenase
MTKTIPLIDVSALLESDFWTGAVPSKAARSAGLAIGDACRTQGFFSIVGHGIHADLRERLYEGARAFFGLPAETKAQVGMDKGGLAWRGWFPVGGELTSGRPDKKEGLYFGAELDLDHPLVKAGTPLHGPNLFLPSDPDFFKTVLEYMRCLSTLGHRLTAGLALGLGLESDHFARAFLRDPLTLFRIFHYPAASACASPNEWGVGAHTDYGFLTILLQDEVGGLQVKSGDNWRDVDPNPDALVCNIGDMLDRLTGGVFRSTLHRVRNTSDRPRLSFPFFFDPGFFARVEPLPGYDALPGVLAENNTEAGASTRWDGVDVLADVGTYGEYLLRKISKVFPELASGVLVQSKTTVRLP